MRKKKGRKEREAKRERGRKKEKAEKKKERKKEGKKEAKKLWATIPPRCRMVSLTVCIFPIEGFLSGKECTCLLPFLNQTGSSFILLALFWVFWTHFLNKKLFTLFTLKIQVFFIGVFDSFVFLKINLKQNKSSNFT